MADFSKIRNGFYGEAGTRKVWHVVDGRWGRELDPGYSAGVNHSPTGFNWGYGGSGPAQLAFALLLTMTGDPDAARARYQEFKRAWVAKLSHSHSWAVETNDIFHLAVGVEPPARAAQPHWTAHTGEDYSVVMMDGETTDNASIRVFGPIPEELSETIALVLNALIANPDLVTRIAVEHVPGKANHFRLNAAGREAVRRARGEA